MSTTKDQILSDIKTAMKAKDQDRLRVLRSLKAALLEKEISKREGGSAELSEEDVVQVLQKAAKQRKDSITQYREGDREDLAEAEEKELEIIESYLPEMMDEEEIRSVAKEVIDQTGAENMSDMGKVMGQIMPKVKGKADGSLVNKVVRDLLS